MGPISSNCQGNTRTSECKELHISLWFSAHERPDNVVYESYTQVKKIQLKFLVQFPVYWLKGAD